MNFRSTKRRVYARMWHDLFYNQPIGQFLVSNHQVVEEQASIYTVFRKKDSEVVLETPSREAALALMLKHARQKKASLMVSHNGELVVFTENEILNA